MLERPSALVALGSSRHTSNYYRCHFPNCHLRKMIAISHVVSKIYGLWIQLDLDLDLGSAFNLWHLL